MLKLTSWRVGKTSAFPPSSVFVTCSDKSTVFLNWEKTHLPHSNNNCNTNNFVHEVNCQILHMHVCIYGISMYNDMVWLVYTELHVLPCFDARISEMQRGIILFLCKLWPLLSCHCSYLTVLMVLMYGDIILGSGKLASALHHACVSLLLKVPVKRGMFSPLDRNSALS